MAFDWKSIVKGVAPTIATVLGGPLAGMGVKAISEAVLGKSDGTEADISLALQGATPEMLVKIKDAEHVFKEKMRKLDIDLLGMVNETMQVESKSDNWWTSGWRPFWGFISGIAFGYICVVVGILLYRAVLGGDPAVMGLIPQVIGSFAALFAIPGAILGVTAWHRGKMQRGK